MILCLLEKRYKSVPGNFHNTDEKGKKEQEGEEEGKEKKIQRDTKPRPLAPSPYFPTF